MSSRDFRFGISSSVQGVDLNQLLVKHAVSTYFMRLASDIPDLGLAAGDIVLVDRSLHPKKTDLVIVGQTDDPELKIVRFDQMHDELQLWGVVVHLVRKLRP